MLRNLVILVCVCVFCAVAGYGVMRFITAHSSDYSIVIKGEEVHNFSFTDINGATHDLSDYRGRTVLVHFWASWCAPCVVEFPDLVDMAHNKKDVVVLAFSTDLKRTSLDRFIAKYAPSLPDNFVIVHDINGRVTQDKFGTYRLPETYILSPELVYTDRIIGAYADWNEMEFK